MPIYVPHLFKILYDQSCWEYSDQILQLEPEYEETFWDFRDSSALSSMDIESKLDSFFVNGHKQQWVEKERFKLK